MQQERKDKGAHNRIIKFMLISVGFLIGFNSASAQIDDFQFQKNFIKTFKYPENLRNSCTPTFTNLLIQISDKGTIQNILISDSAPEDFKDAFNKIKSSININLIDSIIISKKLSKIDIIIPVFYVFTSDNCNNSFDLPGYLVDNYYIFDGKKTGRLSFNLKPIIVSMYKTLH